MRTLSRILSIVFGIALLGLISQGQMNLFIFFLTILFGYFGWRSKSEDDQIDTQKAESIDQSERNMTGIIDYPEDYDVTDEYRFYDTYFRDQMELWKIQHGTIRYEEIKKRVLTSTKLKYRLNKCIKEGGTYIGPKDVAALINGINAFILSKTFDQVLAAQIFVHAWHYNVNRKFKTFNPHQVTKYLNDVVDVISL